MKKVLLLSGFFLWTAAVVGEQIETSNPDLVCAVRKLTFAEFNKLFLIDDGAAYMKRLKAHTYFEHKTLQALDCVINNKERILAKQATSKDTKDSFFKKLTDEYHPIEITIFNNTDKNVVLERNRYIKAYAQAAVATEDLVKKYPRFKTNKIAHIITAAFCGTFTLGGGFLTVLGAGMLREALKAAPTVGAIGAVLTAVVGIITAALAAVTVSSSVLAARAKKMQAKVDQLKSLAPFIKNKQGALIKLPQSAMYIVHPGETFIDTLIIDVNTFSKNQVMASNDEKVLDYKE